MRRFLLSAAAVVALDQLVKALIRVHCAPGVPYRLVGDWVRLRFVHNAGAAFGLFQGGWWFFVAISIVSIGVILYLTLARRYVFPGSFIAFGLILGGALGNLIDRLWLREVIDFIDLGFGAHRWPVFNVADIGVTVGVLYLVVRFVFFDGVAPSDRPPPDPSHDE